MNIKPVRTKTDHRAALKEIGSLMNARANTPEGERLDVLVTLVEAYEHKHFQAAASSRPRAMPQQASSCTTGPSVSPPSHRRTFFTRPTHSS